jgi:hypothetical protein
MSLTGKQEQEILVRIKNGEGVGAIVDEMKIARVDFKNFKRENRKLFADSRKKATHPRRLERLNQRKAALEEQLSDINERIAKIEGEE